MKYTRKQFDAEFPNDAACLERLMHVNYGGTEITCPACGVEKAQFHAMHTRKAYACQECGHHIYPCAGTIFHKSRTPLTMWFFAMYLMTSTRSGVAAKELERALGVTYKTAWRIAHQLRKLMASADHAGPLGGEGKHVEMDETYFGGKQNARTAQEGNEQDYHFRDGRTRRDAARWSGSHQLAHHHRADCPRQREAVELPSAPTNMAAITIFTYSE